MPSPGLAAGSFFLGGQLQGMQAADLQRQLLQQRLLDDQIKRMQLMQQMQQYQQYNQALNNQTPEVRNKLLLGEHMSDIDKMQLNQTRVPEAAAIIDASQFLSPEQKTALKNGLSAANVPDVLNYVNRLKPPPQMNTTELFLRDPAAYRAMREMSWKPDKPQWVPLNQPVDPADPSKGWKTMLVNPNTNEIKDFGNAFKGALPKPAKGEEADIAEEQHKNPGMGHEEARLAVRKGLAEQALNVKNSAITPADRSTLVAIDASEKEAQNVLSAASALGNVSPTELAVQYGRYRSPFGYGGKADPRFEQYFNSIGQLQTDLQQAAQAKGSKAYALIKDLRPHIPVPTDPPWRSTAKVNGFLTGRFPAIRQAIQERGVSSSSGSPGITIPPGYKDLGSGYYSNPVTGKIYHAE